MNAIEHSADTLDGVFIGALGTLPDGRVSAIGKRPVFERIQVTRLGIDGDMQADRDNHGGPERALLHYCSRHYADWRRELPQAAAHFQAPGFGENLSSATLDETQVYIGDLYRIGTALLQVAQPRSPCWKLNQRFGIDDMAVRVQHNQRSGWLYRVIEPGHIGIGDSIMLIERPYSAFSVARVMHALYGRQLDVQALQQITRLGPLSLNWRSKAQRRLEGSLGDSSARLYGG